MNDQDGTRKAEFMEPNTQVTPAPEQAPEPVRETAAQPAPERSLSGEFAVLLNENAKKVTGRVKKSFAEIVPRMQLYSAKTLEEAQNHIRDIIDRGYGKIVCGGGDGTVVQILNQVRAYIDEKNASLQGLSGQMKEKFREVQWPKIGILKLGTGNAWASVVGSRKPKSMLADMKNAALKLSRFNLIESENRVFHFAGLGYDARVLNDYNTLRLRYGKGLFKSYWNGLAGYLSAIFFKSLPFELRRKRPPLVRVISNCDEVYSAAHSSGIQRLSLKAGETMYEGPVNVLGAATTPNYGFNLIAFPFARVKPDFMNFRLISSNALELIGHMRSMWQGTYESCGIKDFLARDVTLEFSEPMPFQIGGDGQGFREKLRMRVSDLAVEVIDLT